MKTSWLEIRLTTRSFAKGMRYNRPVLTDYRWMQLEDMQLHKMSMTDAMDEGESTELLTLLGIPVLLSYNFVQLQPPPLYSYVDYRSLFCVLRRGIH